MRISTSAKNNKNYNLIVPPKYTPDQYNSKSQRHNSNGITSLYVFLEIFNLQTNRNEFMQNIFFAVVAASSMTKFLVLSHFGGN